MEVFFTILTEIKRFLGIGPALEIIQSGNYDKFLTYEGIKSILGSMIPFFVNF